MEAKTHEKLTKGLHIISFIVFISLLLWNIYSPSGGIFTLLDGRTVEPVSYGATASVYFTAIFALLAFNYLVRLLRPKK